MCKVREYNNEIIFYENYNKNENKFYVLYIG